MITEIKTNQHKIPRMRTVREAAEEMKKLDANTAVTEYHIRRLVLDGALPKIKAGNNRSKSLQTLISGKNYSDINFGIKLCRGNIGHQNDIYTFPYFCAFLLKRFFEGEVVIDDNKLL